MNFKDLLQLKGEMLGEYIKLVYNRMTGRIAYSMTKLLFISSGHYMK